MRLIDADAMLETLKRKYPQWYTGKPKDSWMHYAWLVYHRAVENAPTIDAMPCWIPCEERLPEECDEYLCCDKDGDYYVYYLEDADWARRLTENESIVAWMPLPEPYDGERKDDE